MASAFEFYYTQSGDEPDFCCVDCNNYLTCDMIPEASGIPEMDKSHLITEEDIYKLPAEKPQVTAAEEIEIDSELKLVRMWVARCLTANRYAFFDKGYKPVDQVHADRIKFGQTRQPSTLDMRRAWEARPASYEDTLTLEKALPKEIIIDPGDSFS
jgi:hypothetical protein